MSCLLALPIYLPLDLSYITSTFPVSSKSSYFADENVRHREYH